MLIYIVRAFLFVLMLVTIPPVYAQQIALSLSPNASKELTNNYGWTLAATCTIKTINTNKIRVSIVSNKGIVNGKNLHAGQATSFRVHDNESISVSAEPGTTVNLSNLSDQPVLATCST